MTRSLVLAAVLACTTPCAFAAPAVPAAAAHDPAASVRLNAFFADEWERGLVESPENATYNGDHRFDDRWSDQSPAAIAKVQAADRAALAQAKAFDRAGLSEADLLNLDTFLWQLERSVERQRFKGHLQPIGHQGGVQTADGMAEVMPFRTAQDYRHWLARMAAVPTLVEQTIVLADAGAAEKRMPPKVLLERVPAQIDAQIVDAPEKSPFYRPFAKMPESLPAVERARLQAEAQATIRDAIVPAYRRLKTWFAADYLPKAPTDIAATALPDGKAYYAFQAAWFTTTDLSPDRIHRIGLDEVKRIRAEMEKIRAEVKFDGDLAAFFTYLRTDPKFFETTPEALLARYRAVSKRIDPELVKVFRTIPRQPYGVRAIPDNIAPDTTTAYYQPGAADGSRPGWYYVNLYKPETRPTWEMIPLSLHEAVPGHHFQFARGLELPDAPMFRRTAYFVAYGEGWGLYAERLGYDMGLYEDPYDRMGQLAYDMWRAVRLVVDTGMHAKGWSRERAIEYFMANSPKTRQDVVNEIDRYIAWPGQALAYKIGQMKISELRETASKRLGERFDLRDFNDAVLETGSVPLAVLEAHMRRWMDEQAAKKAAGEGTQG